MTERGLPEALGDLARKQEAAPLDERAVAALAAPLSAEEAALILGGVPRPAPRPSRARWAAAALLPLAAALLLWLVRPGVAPLPAYELEVLGAGTVKVRGEARSATAAWSLAADTRLELVLRPAEEVRDPVSARAVWLTGGTANELPLATELDPRGALRLRGRVRLPAGPGELVVGVGRTDDVAAWQPGAAPPPQIRVMRKAGEVQAVEEGGL